MSKRYYDPGKAPKPRRQDASTAPSGPIGNSRQQRRARARLSFEEQLTVAASAGFPTPDLALIDATPHPTRAEWIEAWERAYAAK